MHAVFAVAVTRATPLVALPSHSLPPPQRSCQNRKGMAKQGIKKKNAKDTRRLSAQQRGLMDKFVDPDSGFERLEVFLESSLGVQYIILGVVKDNHCRVATYPFSRFFDQTTPPTITKVRFFNATFVAERVASLPPSPNSPTPPPSSPYRPTPPLVPPQLPVNLYSPRVCPFNGELRRLSFFPE